MNAIKIPTLFFLLFHYSPLLLAQDFNYPAYRIFELEQKNTLKKGQAYVLASASKVGDYHNVYVINQRDSSIDYHGRNGVFKFEKQAKNDLGEWERIDTYRGSCGTGKGYSSIPSDHYVCGTIDNDLLLGGEFKTEIRFLCRTKDTVLVSKPIPASIDYRRFESIKKNIYQAKMDSLLAAGDMGPEREKLMYLSKLKATIKRQAYEEAIDQSKLLLQKYPDFLNTHYYYGRALSALAATDKTLSEKEKKALYRKAILTWQKIPKDHSLYPTATFVSEFYSPYWTAPKE